jgi:hypothetical protein
MAKTPRQADEAADNLSPEERREREEQVKEEQAKARAENREEIQRGLDESAKLAAEHPGTRNNEPTAGQRSADSDPRVDDGAEGVSVEPLRPEDEPRLPPLSPDRIV